MNAAGATTITVNTSLFAAGDTVFIQNLGAGVCTITAGTATVNTYSSLALNQYEGGHLYFTSASAAIFYKSDGAAAASGGMTLISTTTLTGSAINLTSIPTTYNDLRLVIRGFRPSTDQIDLRMRINSVTGNNYTDKFGTGENLGNGFIFNNIENIHTDADNGTSQGLAIIDFPDYANTSTWKTIHSLAVVNNYTTTTQAQINWNVWFHDQTAAITTINLFCSGGNFAAGTALLYGVK
jgi:hypothetical protein